MRLSLILLVAITGFSALSARPFPVPKKDLVDFGRPTLSVEEHYNAGMEAIQGEQWAEACKQFEYVRYGFPDSSFTSEALYLQGVAYFHQGAYEMANRRFSEYLTRERTPGHFLDVFQYKLSIADAWREGSRKHLFGSRYFPRFVGARRDSLDLYEEIATALPGHDIGAKATFAKAALLSSFGDYQESIEKYQAFLLRFPKHPRAPEAYLRIAENYLEQIRIENHNPDYLALAEVNIRKFRSDFPTDERLLTAEARLAEMRETAANGLYETGRFFERTHKPGAAIVYYEGVINDFPYTESAKLSRDRLTLVQSLVSNKG